MSCRTCEVCLHKNVCEARGFLIKAHYYAKPEKQREVLEVLERVLARYCMYFKTIKKLEKEAEE
ncbi:MAG: hypothetical protein ACXQTI_02720 [Candidatus Nezhaarchaeales archaeon]